MNSLDSSSRIRIASGAVKALVPLLAVRGLARIRVLGIVACVLVSAIAADAAGQVIPTGDLPSPILSEQVYVLLEQAEASENQSAAIRGLHALYREHWRAEFGARVSALRSMVARINGMIAHPETPDDGENTVSLLAKYRDEAGTVRPSLIAANDAFWEQAGVILNESQRPQLECAQRVHRRMELQPREGVIRERHIDLVDLYRPFLTLVDAADGAQRDPAAWSILRFDATESQAVLQILMEWERDRVHALEALVIAEIRAASLRAQAMDMRRAIRLADLSPQEREAQSRPADALRAEAARFDLPPSRRLVELNRLTLTRIKDVLAPDKQRAASMLYFEEAYPEVYPDTVSAEHLYRIAAAIDSLNVEQRSHLTDLHEAFQLEHDRLSERMMESVYKRGLVEFARGPDCTVALASEFERQMQLGREREALDFAQLAQIRSVLLSEHAALLPEWDFEKKPPKRPWMRGGK